MSSSEPQSTPEQRLSTFNSVCFTNLGFVGIQAILTPQI
jgi:hypothetical protein